jgi:hypothetical protein
VHCCRLPPKSFSHQPSSFKLQASHQASIQNSQFVADFHQSLSVIKLQTSRQNRQDNEAINLFARLSYINKKQIYILAKKTVKQHAAYQFAPSNKQLTSLPATSFNIGKSIMSNTTGNNSRPLGNGESTMPTSSQASQPASSSGVNANAAGRMATMTITETETRNSNEEVLRLTLTNRPAVTW